jgi:hypothetical protein
MFAFICYVSIHLEISATVVQAMKVEVRTGEALSQGHNRQHDRSSCSRRNRCRRSDVIDETRPALRGQMSGALVGQEPSHLVLSR